MSGGNLRISEGNLHGKKNKIQMWNLDSFVLSLDGVCNDRLRTSGRGFSGRDGSDEENSNRKQEKRALRMRITWRQGKIPKNSLLFQMLDQREYRKFSFGFATRNANSTENIR